MTEGGRDGEETDEDTRKEARLHPRRAIKQPLEQRPRPQHRLCLLLCPILSRVVNLCLFSLVEKDGEWPAPRALRLQFLQTSGLS